MQAHKAFKGKRLKDFDTSVEAFKSHLVSKFNFLTEYNSASLRSVLVIISLLLHLIYSQMEIKKIEKQLFFFTRIDFN